MQHRQSSFNCTSKQYIVQLNLPHTVEMRYLNIRNLYPPLEKDLDLAALPRKKLGLIIQRLYIIFQNNSQCNLSEQFLSTCRIYLWTSPTKVFTHGNQPINSSNGFLSFVCQVGTSYFKKHLAVFISSFSLETPVQLFNSIEPSVMSDMPLL